MVKRKVLIISPYFPPCNAADMQRVRMSLAYFDEYGWEAEVVSVDPDYADIFKDEGLLQSIPDHIKIHQVKALNKSWTSKFGLGSIALRSIMFYKKKVNELLSAEKFDLVYFSTTQFPVCILGAYWRKRYGIPYIIDMQDPWHSDYYLDKPKAQRPSKYWYSYRLNKYLEPIALKNASGIISVSEKYITDIKQRYPEIANVPSVTITFGAFGIDMDIAAKYKDGFTKLLDKNTVNIVYIGRGGMDMHAAIKPVFEALKAGLNSNSQIYRKLKFYFIGTSYAQAGHGIPTIMPLAASYGVTDHVIELTERISFYHTLNILQQADALFVPGSDDPKYTASKIYPYLLSRRPILAIFNKHSSALIILNEFGAKHVFDYERINRFDLDAFFSEIVTNGSPGEEYDPAAMQKYSASQMALNQCLFFEHVISRKI